ncbi:hypothetical protein BC834DRAFT_60087 [Gloeopeniophorella convolvens]|nr:hypothetical protein BC834DRAFT_60087 [Gloeopeniophorella convolvens]
MHVLLRLSVAWAVALLLLLFPAPTTAQTLSDLLFFAPVPLEVRSPYLNFWTPASATSNTTVSTAAEAQAQFFFTDAFAGRTVLIRIDGVTHAIFGQLPLANQTNVTGVFVTPTRTTFTFQIGPLELSAAFFSPIEPGDWVRQSTPFAYWYLEMGVTDGKAHDVQIYAHVQTSDFFLTDGNSNVTFSTWATGQSLYHEVQLQDQRLFSENAQGQAEWGALYFTTAMNDDDVTYDIGSEDSLVHSFSVQGNLKTPPATATVIEGTTNTSSVFALVRNLGTVTTNSSAVFSLGFVQSPAIQFAHPSGGTQLRVPYFHTKYVAIGDLIDAFLGDFSSAWQRGLHLESQIDINSAGLPSDYLSLLGIATRLTMSSAVLTAGTLSDGTVDGTDVTMFMKNIGALTGSNRVTPVEVLYSAFPTFMYFDPTLGALLLEPLLEYQTSSHYTRPYAMPDAGTFYPNTTFSNVIHLQGVEQTANMLIMTYAYSRISGDGSLINAYYEVLAGWADYLIESTLFTETQVSADGLEISNQTNLAVKGIIALKAMSVMSASAGVESDSSKFSSVATSYINQWKELALGSDNHVLAQYGNESSWSLAYNMFVDKWLQTELIGEDIFTAHSNFLKHVNITIAPLTFSIAGIGIPFDSFRPNNISYSSNMFAAGYADLALQNTLISAMRSEPLTEEVSINDDSLTAWSRSADLGAAFAPLVLTVPSNGIHGNASAPASRAGGHSSAARKAGIALGCLALATVLLGLLYTYRRRRRVRGALAAARMRFRPGHRAKRDSNAGMLGVGVGAGAGDEDDMMKLDFIPYSKSDAVRVRREAGWKNLEDYEYDG